MKQIIGVNSSVQTAHKLRHFDFCTRYGLISHFLSIFPFRMKVMMLKLKHSRVLHLFLANCNRELIDPKIMNQRTAPRFWSCIEVLGKKISRLKTTLQALTLPPRWWEGNRLSDGQTAWATRACQRWSLLWSCLHCARSLKYAQARDPVASS